MFIQVTDLNGNEIRVNTQQMVYYYGTSDGETELTFWDGHSLFVRQSAEALDLIVCVVPVKEEK